MGVVASGHAATTAAAATLLQDGGNAVDAAVGAVLAAAVAEPCLTSPGGGGFLLVRTAAGEEVLVDGFVAAPGLGRPATSSGGELVRVPVDFGHAVQDFHVGTGSVAVPGLLAGLLHAHERFGRLDLHRVVAPAVALAREGVEVDRFGAQLVGLLVPILARTATGRALFFRDDRPIAVGERFTNEALGQFLDDVGRGHRHGLRADELGGGVTGEDLAAYRVLEREPLRLRHRDADVVTNPPPSFGASLVAHGLERLGAEGPLGPPGDPRRAVRLVGALVAMAEHRRRLAPGSTQGTTHVSVADAVGNVVAVTSSNGSGSGEFAGDTGVQLNNVMGEEDLHPAGLGTATPGVRIGSMMAPTLVERGGRVVAVGSGGSERIRSTITQLVVRLVDDGAALADAVEAPRLHWDGTGVQAEPGFTDAELDALASRWPVNRWSRRDLYFGGAHGVAPPGDAAGDPRRGGAGAVVRSVGA
jgi:gamma-glutamyltranspeptidase/glutathione hydrolase